jgi:uncharacterized protein involved in cysteine biosynthesis
MMTLINQMPDWLLSTLTVLLWIFAILNAGRIVLMRKNKL